jgi:colanic acid/amylovoran biosynthesis glycosyltransferase
LKIAYFINEYPKVSHSFIRREILALEQQGISVQRIAARGWTGPLPDEEDQRERGKTSYLLRNGSRALLLPTLQALLRSPLKFFAALRLAIATARHSDRSLAHHLIYLAEACRVVQWTKRFGAQHLHAHFGTNSTDVAMLAHALGGPAYSFTVHGPEEFFRPVALSTKIARAAFVVAVSSFGRSQLCLWSRHTDWAKIHVVHCGLEKAFFQTAAALPAPVPRLVCVGRLAEQKGQTLLIEAMAMLAAKGVDCELVLAGDGPARAEIESLIAESKLSHCVRITGWISSRQVREEIVAARALVLPSFAEGLPVVIMEAMALRRPVLSTYVAGIPELVRTGENGWLFPAGSVPDLAQAMEECLSASPQQLRQMGDAAYRRVARRHSIETSGLAALFRASARVRDSVTWSQDEPLPRSLATHHHHRVSAQTP